MRVFSKHMCGFDRSGRVLLQKGENTLAEPLTSTERAFVDVMVKAKVVTIMPEEAGVPEAPVSETKIKAAKPTSARVDVKKAKAKKAKAAPLPAKKPMRVRRAAG